VTSDAITPNPHADFDRHRLAAPLTRIQARTQLLQRQLARMDNMPEAERAHCAAALADILDACRTLTHEVGRLLEPPRR
jgi:hypothetical protein